MLHKSGKRQSIHNSCFHFFSTSASPVKGPDAGTNFFLTLAPESGERSKHKPFMLSAALVERASRRKVPSSQEMLRGCLPLSVSM